MVRFFLIFIVLTFPLPVFADDFAALWYSTPDELSHIVTNLTQIKEIRVIGKVFPTTGLSVYSGPISIMGIGSHGYYVFKSGRLTSVCFETADFKEVESQIQKYIGKNLTDERGSSNERMEKVFSLFMDGPSASLIADDAEGLYSSAIKKTILGEVPESKTGTIRINAYTLPRSKIILFWNTKTNIGLVIEVEDVSHLNGIYTSEDSLEIYILDNKLYYVLRLPEPSATLGVADITEYPLSAFKDVYKYQEGRIVFLNVSDLGSRFILDNSSAEAARTQLEGLQNENAQILGAQREAERERKIVR